MPPPEPVLIILLGFTNDEHGTLSDIALQRCAHAIGEFHRHPGAFILPTGAFGSHFNTSPAAHGEYLTRHLVASGIPAECILPFTQSSSTIEDAALSRLVVAQYGFHRLIVVTSDFHMPRAELLFRRTFLTCDLTFSPASTITSPEELARRQAHETTALARLTTAGL